MKTIHLILIAAAALTTIGVFLAANKTSPSLTKTTEIPLKVQQAFMDWKKQYAMAFNKAEESYRLSVFYENYQFINSHQGKEYTLGLNEFAAHSRQEFNTQYLGYIGAQMNTNGVQINGDIPASVDWRTKGGVSKVKNQGSCGSCWAFSSTGALESADFVFNGTLGDFSEQQLVDCSGDFGNQGCNGGWMNSSFQYVMQYGITDEDSYPYQGMDQTCQPFNATFKVSNFSNVPAGDCASLQAAVAQQPVSVAVDASMGWQFYIGGVFPSWMCGKNLDHGVLAVGYDAKSNWLVKNSWGALWGRKGYITLKKGNTCGVCNAATFPIL